MRKIPVSDNKQRSGPHRRVEKILDEMGISYLSEEEFPPYTVDIYLPEWHLGIEIDGPFHSYRKDLVRDEFIEAYYGLPILRIHSKGWITKDNVEEAVTEFIEDFSEDVYPRKHIWLTRHSRD